MQLYIAIMVTILVLYFASSEIYARYQRRNIMKAHDAYEDKIKELYSTALGAREAIYKVHTSRSQNAEA